VSDDGFGPPAGKDNFCCFWNRGECVGASGESAVDEAFFGELLDGVAEMGSMFALGTYGKVAAEVREVAGEGSFVRKHSKNTEVLFIEW
jgi:hypothetical protein